MTEHEWKILIGYGIILLFAIFSVAEVHWRSRHHPRSRLQNGSRAAHAHR